MRILTVTHFFEQHGGGIERVAGYLCRAFCAEGHEVVWAASGASSTPYGGESIVLPSWNGVELATGLPMPIPGVAALRRLWRAVGAADAVVVHDALYVTSIAALIAARVRRRPIVLVQHVGELPFGNRLLRSCLAVANRLVGRTMLAAADQTVFISATTQRYFGNIQFSRPPRLLFNGVDDRIFSFPHDVLTRTPSAARRILFVGRFVEKKGLATIFALARMRPDLTFILAGNGPINPDEWGLPNVTVSRGLSGSALADLYRSADMLLLPSVGEGFPLVIQEAMACGLPVICGADSAIADPDATRFLTGIAIHPARPDHNAALAAKMIDRMAMNETERREMADYAHGRYRWKTMAAAITKMIAAIPRST